MGTDERLTAPATYIGGAPPKPPKRRRGLWLLFPFFLIAFLLLFSWWHITHTDTTAYTPPTATFTSVPATMPGGAGGTATAVPGTSATPPPGTTATPAKGTPPASTPAPGVTPTTGPTATPVPGAPPTIAVSQTTFSQLLCVATTITFTVTNSGGGVLNYHVTSTNTLYRIRPTTGSLHAGQTDTVTVSGILTGGTITVSAPGATNTQTITLKCL